MIKLTLHNKYFIRIDTDNYDFLRGLYEHVSDYVDGYEWMPRYKAGLWDGKISLLNRNDRTVPFGLLPEILKYHKQEFSEDGLVISDEVRCLFIYKNHEKIKHDELTLSLPLRDYQFECIKSAIKYKNGIIIVGTGGGKTLTQTFLMKVLVDNNVIEKPILIVPRTDLVLQFKSDMIEYGVDENDIGIVWGDEKDFTKTYTISTWQSLKNFEEHFECYDFLLIDEVQKCSDLNVLAEISKKCINAKFRLGFTGTIANCRLRELQVRSFIGPVLKKYDTKYLQQRGFLVPCEVKVIKIKYSKKDFGGEQAMKNMTKEDVYKNPRRLNEIKYLVRCHKDEPIIILVEKIEKEGEVLKKYLEDELPGNREIVFISGSMSPKKREVYYNRCREGEKLIIIAISAVFQEGINIPNLETVILSSPSSSQIRVLQTIGRTLRLSKGKNKSVIYDIVDQVPSKPKFARSYNIRREFYEDKDFDITEYVK